MLGGEVVVVRVEGFGVRDDVGGCEDGLVAIVVEGVVNVGGAGHLAGGGGGIGGVVVYRAILGIEGISTQTVHGLAIVTDAGFEVAWVVVAVAAVITVADVIADVARCLACGLVFCGACACGFVIGFVPPLHMLETPASRARRLFRFDFRVFR